jgi:preprotein translocase subunit SecG
VFAHGNVWVARGDPKMLDTLMVVAGVAFFVLAIAYVAACDRM